MLSRALWTCTVWTMKKRNIVIPICFTLVRHVWYNTMFQKQSDHSRSQNIIHQPRIAQRHLVFHFESPYLNMTNSIGPFGNIFMKSPNSERNTPSIQKKQVNDLKCVQKKRSLYSIWHVHMLPVGMQIWISQYGQ